MAGYRVVANFLVGSLADRPSAAQHTGAVYLAEDLATAYRSDGATWITWPTGGGGSTDWVDITNKPSTFAPSSHTHPSTDVTGLDTTLIPTSGQKNALSGTQGTPGATNQYVTTQDGRLSDARAPTAHTHPQTDVTGLVAALAAKQDAATAASWTAVVKQAADLSNSTVTFANTDLVFTFVANGVYAVDLYLLAQAAAATTGFGFAFDTSVATTVAALSFTHVLANTGTVTAGHSRADAAATGLSSGVDTINAVVPIIGSGLIVAAATGGTARLVFRPEVAAAATFKANSVMRVHKVA